VKMCICMIIEGTLREDLCICMIIAGTLREDVYMYDNRGYFT